MQVLLKLVFILLAAFEKRKLLSKLRKNTAKNIICLFIIFKRKQYIFLIGFKRFPMT